MIAPEKIERLSRLAETLGCKYIKDEPLKAHTTFKIGGPCDIMIMPNSCKALAELVKTASELEIKYMILGNGSNVLFSDNGYRGAVFILGADMSKISVSGNVITAYAGALLSKVCRTALECSLSGLEFAYGIPGTVGGAVYMNAGAYGGEIKDVVKSVSCINVEGVFITYRKDDLDLGYRKSRFTGSDEIIVGAEFELKQGNSADIKSAMDELTAKRKSRQPLEYPSAGSAFKRPEGTYAGLVIEQSGMKGYSVGDAQISEKHANFIINKGNATAEDVKKLISDVQKAVKEKTGYTLECEVKLIGG